MTFTQNLRIPILYVWKLQSHLGPFVLLIKGFPNELQRNQKHTFHLLKFNLGFTLLCTTNDDQLMEKWIYFVKIKFHSNENIEWHYM
jgi:hypothetical protein